MKLSDVLTIETIVVPLESTDKYAAIEELVDVLVSTKRIPDRQGLLQAVLTREQTRTTGIGDGLAIPHGKCENLQSLVMAAGKPKTPMDFQSIDGQPVNFIFLLGAPIDQTGPHIQTLARISRFMTLPTFRRQIRQAQTPQEVYRAIVAHEKE